ncbi:MAG: glyoxylase I family protein [Limisphaerales bacterium]
MPFFDPKNSTESIFWRERMILGIHHVAVGVPDIEAGLAFYRDVLGFEQVERTSFSGSNAAVEAAIGIKEPAAHMAMLRGGNAYIELWQYEHPAPRNLTANPPDLGFPHFALEVTDIHQEHARLEAAGMTFVGPPVEFGDSAAVYGRDPFGNVIEIYQIDTPDRARIDNTPMVSAQSQNQPQGKQ